MPTLLWFRHDLRLQDNPALQAAIERGEPLIPVYILDEEDEGDWPPGGASRWWLHHALSDLQEQLAKHGLHLILRRGKPREILQKLVAEAKARAVYWNRRYEPAVIHRDKAIKEQLKQDGLDAQSFNSALLFEPWEIKNKSGDPYKVFTPYWKTCLSQSIPEVVDTKPAAAKVPESWPSSDRLDDWQLLPKLSWDKQFYDFWTPTRQGGWGRLHRFIDDAMGNYSEGRNQPGTDGTSCLSPYLHFGQLGPREVHDALQCKADPARGGARKYFAEIGWREFSYHILYHFPHTPTEPLYPEFKQFPWEPDEALLQAWQKGQTGYPLVDAGMRQLWATGWMHNRVRMNVASLLVKHLQQPWQDGARWFWDTLVDADLASNTQGWQWSAGCGADGAPYFRVFNPMMQGDKFDPDGDYARRWVPELAQLPNQYIYKPWEAPREVLRKADVCLGENYPKPIVDHVTGRNRALTAYDKLKHFAKKNG